MVKSKNLKNQRQKPPIIIIIMQIYIAHWENNMFYLMHFTFGLGLGKCFFEIKGFKMLFEF